MFCSENGASRYVLERVVFFSLLSISSLQAQTSDSLRLQTVVIQATRAGRQDPAPHSNLTAAQIGRVLHAQDVPMLLGSLPSVVETSDAGAGIGYTALRVRGSDPTRINVTLNGIPLNDAESQNVFWVDLPDLASSAAEIQVQRGVGTSTNGPAAFGATVNVDLSRIQADPSASLTNTLGSFGTRRHSLQVNTGLLNQHWAFSGRLSHIQSEGYIDRASARLNSYHLTGSYSDEKQTLQGHILSGHERTYQAWNGVPVTYVEDPKLRTYNSAGAEKPGEPYENEVDDYLQRHHFLHYRRELGRGLQLQLNGHYTRGYGYFEQYKADQNLHDYGFLVPDTVVVTDLVRRRWLDNHFYGITYALRWAPGVNPPSLGGAPEFLLGGAVSRYRGHHFGEIIWSEYAYGLQNKDRYYDNRSNKWDGNIFLKMQLSFKNGLRPYLDLQYRLVNYSFWGFNTMLQNTQQQVELHFFNPKLGISWAFLPNFSAYGFFGIANREPNRDDYTQSTPQSRPQAERLYDAEAGLRFVNKNWNLNANLFYMYYRNQLALDGRLNDVGAYIRTNIPESYRLGLELEGRVLAVSRLELAANATLSQNRVAGFVEYRDNWDTGGQDAVLHENSDLSFSPGLITRLEAGYHFLPAGKRWQPVLTLIGKYVGKQYLDNTSNPFAALDPYFTTDLRFNLDWQFKQSDQKIQLILTVFNLLDARYENNGWTYRYTSQAYDDRPFNPYTRLETGGSYNQTGLFPQAGRHWMLSLVLGF